jgi:putative tricarboxylic transport membrane protein
MKLNDALIGLLLIAFSSGIIAVASRFPLMPGQPFGPSLLPTLIAVGLILAGLVLIVRGMRAGRRQAWLEVDDWVRTPKLVFDFLLMIGAVAFYIALSDELGYLIAAPLALFAFLLATGVGPLAALPIAVLVPPIIHYIFYTVLKVPLPWGLLTEYAW